MEDLRNDSSVTSLANLLTTQSPLLYRVGLSGNIRNNSSDVDGSLVSQPDVPEQTHPPAVEVINLMGLAFACLSIILNTVFLLSRCITKQKKSAYNQFMTNLSVSDIMTSVSFLIVQYWPRGPFANIDANPDFYLVPALPYVFRSLPWLFFTSYLLTLNCLTINQWIAVCRPWKYSALATKMKIRFSLLLIWAIASLQVIVPLAVLILLSSLKDRQEAKKKLWTVPKIEMHVWMALYALSTFFNVFLNIVVYRKISKLKRKRRGVHASNSGMSNIRMKQEAFVTVSMLLAACLFCRIPFPIFGIIGVEFSNSMSANIYFIGNAGVIFLLHLNCLIDPIIYICRTRDLKIAMKTVLRKVSRSPCCYNSWKSPRLSSQSMRSEDVVTSRDRVSMKQDTDYSVMVSTV